MDYSKYPSQQPTRKAWQGMMNRCYTKTNKDYPSVGGKGIKVCERWHDYENFKEDMGEKPTNAQFKRYVNSKGFEPGNCYWEEKVNSRRNRLYSIWKNIRRRCGVIGVDGNKSTKRYAELGINMDPDWAENYHLFAEYVGQPPTDKHTLDRIDNNIGYHPGNVRWATPKEQANNRSDNIYIEMYGQRKTLQQWCEYYGVDRPTISSRWRVLFDKPKRKNRVVIQKTLEGDTIDTFKNTKDASSKTGISYSAISKCLSGGNNSAGGYIWEYVNS